MFHHGLIRRLLLLLVCSQLGGLAARAQVAVGIQLAPTVGISRAAGTYTTNDSHYYWPTATLEATDARLCISGGLTVEIGIGDRGALSTGLQLSQQGKLLTLTNWYDQSPDDYPYFTSVSVRLRYAQVPLALKLFIDTCRPTSRYYLLAGGQVSRLLRAQVSGAEDTGHAAHLTATNFAPWDAGLRAGAGVEWQLAGRHRLFSGLTYQHGLVNVLRGELLPGSAGRFTNYNSAASAEVGLLW